MASKGNSPRDGNRRRTSSRPVTSDPNSASSISRLSSGSSSRLSLEEVQLAQVKAREERSRDDELQYFTVETKCLGCKKKLTAQVTELRGRLTCPRCQTIMHMGPDGKWHKGPPPSVVAKAPTITRWHRLCYRFPFLRKPGVQWGGGLVLLALVAVVVFAISHTPPVHLPPQLVPRSRGVCEFVIAGDDGKFKQFLASGSKGDGADWYDQIHTVIQKHKTEGFFTSVENVEAVFENALEGRASVKVTLNFRPTAPQGSELTLPLLLAWKQESGKGWVLDGTETLKQLGR